jgi:hypothetical protein
MTRKRFFIFTADHSGLPLAVRLKQEGYEVFLVLVPPEDRDGEHKRPKNSKEVKDNAETVAYLRKNGNGLVDKMWAAEAMRKICPRDYVNEKR